MPESTNAEQRRQSEIKHRPIHAATVSLKKASM